jgi:hypothetical protein
MNVCDLWKTPSFDEHKLMYECKVLWNIIMNQIEIFVLKSFGIIYECVKFMVREWCDIIIIHRKQKVERILMQTKTYIFIIMQ